MIESFLEPVAPWHGSKANWLVSSISENDPSITLMLVILFMPYIGNVKIAMHGNVNELITWDSFSIRSVCLAWIFQMSPPTGTFLFSSGIPSNLKKHVDSQDVLISQGSYLWLSTPWYNLWFHCTCSLHTLTVRVNYLPSEKAYVLLGVSVVSRSFSNSLKEDSGILSHWSR